MFTMFRIINGALMGHILTMAAFLFSWSIGLWWGAALALCGYALVWLYEALWLDARTITGFLVFGLSAFCVAASWALLFGQMFAWG